jgi:hypothetical protein
MCKKTLYFFSRTFFDTFLLLNALHLELHLVSKNKIDCQFPKYMNVNIQ